MSSKGRHPSTKDEEKRKRAAKAEATAAGPEWRSVQIASAPREPQFAGFRSPPQPKGFDSFGSSAPIDNRAHLGGRSESSEIIDKEAFFKTNDDDLGVAGKQATEEDQSSNWTPTKLRPVPAFYPLEKSSRFIDDELPAVATRVSECLRVLSVQAIYDNETATASLMTAENVEMHLSLWRTPGGKQPDGIVVELQRRKGCSITFHRYSRHILDAAVGDFDLPEFVLKNGEDIDRAYSRKLERLLSTGKDMGDEKENAIIAIEIAHGLLMKDRMDARQLGLESLCLLTDPRKTGSTTAVIASSVVLLGTGQLAQESQDDDMMFDEAPFQEIRETILSLVLLRRIGDEAEFDDDDADRESDEDEYDMTGKHPEEQEHLRLLHNLALAVMANALDVIENFESYDTEPEETDKKIPAIRGRAGTSADDAEFTSSLDEDAPPIRQRALTVDSASASSLANTFMDEAKDFSKRDILSTLIQELGKAGMTPHNACLSAKCLRCLCRASHDARRRARELGAKNVVNTALDVGVRTHSKLETECKKVVKVLTEHADETD